MQLLGPFASRVIRVVGDAQDAGVEVTIGTVASTLRVPVAQVDRAVRNACEQGYLVGRVPPGADLPDGVAVRLGPLGEQLRRNQALLERLGDARPAPADGSAPGPLPLGEVGRQLARAWDDERDERAAALAESRAHWLVGDTEREQALSTLGQAYAENRIDLAEHERRTTLVLAARDRGALALALQDLPTEDSSIAPGPTALATVSRLVSWVRVLALGVAAVLVLVVVVGIVLAVLPSR